VGGAVVEIAGQGAAIRVTAAVSQFGLQDAGGAGAEENANTGLAVTGDGVAHTPGETVGLQSKLRQPVVAAIVAGQHFWQFLRVDRSNLADPGIQPHRLESTGCQAAAIFAQSGQQRIKPVAQTRACGIGGNEQWGHGRHPFDQASILDRNPGDQHDVGKWFAFAHRQALDLEAETP